MSTDPQTDCPPEVEIRLKLYGWLRDEINQSYERQHRIVAGQATLIGLAVGLQFSLDAAGILAEQPVLETMLQLVLVAIPPLVVVSASFWLIEHIRVMRAGNYLQLLEQTVNGAFEGDPLTWETWLRDPPRRSGLRRFLSPHFLYDVCHFIGYPLFFLVTGGVSLYVAFLTDPGDLMAIYVGVLATLLILLVLLTLTQIRHEWQDLSEQFPGFEGWTPQGADDNPTDA